MAQVKFAYGTKARYDALSPKDLDTLYFTTDTLQLFKGTTEYTKSTKMVSALPAAGQVQGIIYFRMTDYTMHIWNGVEFVQLNKTTVTQIPADATNDDIPTTKAVADYVQAKIEAVEQKKGLYVTDVTYKDGVISVAKNDEPVTTTLTGVVHAPTYDAETRTIKMPVFGGDELTIALGKDLVVKSGVYNTKTHEIELTITTGEVIKIPVGSLIDIYVGVATATATVTVSDDNKISVDGLAPAPAAGAANRYLRSDGTWQVPPDTNTTYGTFKAATASAAGGSGLVPAPAAGKQGQYLRGDGTLATPTNTTYSDATQSTHGLMSTSDKKKLDGFGAANTY